MKGGSALIIDSHCHIYPDAIAPRAVEGIGRFYDMPLSYRGTARDLCAVHDLAGVTHAVVFSVATTPHQVKSINAFIAEAVKDSGGRFVGLGTLHPDSECLEEELEHIASLGLRGVKLHPDFQRFHADGARSMRICAMCEERALPVLLHCGDARYDFSSPSRIARVLKSFPRLTVLGAHLGGWSQWEEALRLLPAYENFYVDTCSSLYALSPTRAKEIIRAYGAHRVLFGTDYPMWDIADELSRLHALELEREEEENILFCNACRLFGFFD